MQFIIQNLTMQDHDDFRLKVGRRASELMICLKAADAEWMLNLLAECSPVDIAKLCSGQQLVDDTGESRPIFEELQAQLLATKQSLEIDGGAEPTSADVKQALKTELESQIGDGGDYNTFLAYMEFVLARQEDPSLVWETFKSSLGIYDGRNMVLDRIQKHFAALSEEERKAAKKNSKKSGDDNVEELPLASKTEQ